MRHEWVKLRLKRLVFLVMLLTIVVFCILHKLYFSILIYKERKPICKQLNLNHRAKSCDDAVLQVNPKRSRFQELLTEWINISETFNISYILSSGSLLGQYRNQDLIPWDYDVDILVDDSTFATLKKIASPRNFIEGRDDEYHFVIQPEYDIKPRTAIRRWNCNGQVVEGQPDHCSFIGPVARLIKGFDFVDIFGLNIRGNWAFEQYEKKFFHIDDLFPTRNCLFMEIKTKCPNKVKKVLQTFFHSVQQPCFCVAGIWHVLPWWKW